MMTMRYGFMVLREHWIKRVQTYPAGWVPSTATQKGTSCLHRLYVLDKIKFLY